MLNLYEEQIADLQEQVRYWKELAIGKPDIDGQCRIAGKLGVTPAVAWLLNRLYQANGAVVESEKLLAGLPGWTEARGNNTLQVQLCRLRKALPDRNWIVNVHGIGYRLNAEGISFVRSIRG